MGKKRRKATILTTNLDYPEWYDLFKRKPLVDALLDRLRHHCITVRINGPSLRVPEQLPIQPSASHPVGGTIEDSEIPRLSIEPEHSVLVYGRVQHAR